MKMSTMMMTNARSLLAAAVVAGLACVAGCDGGDDGKWFDRPSRRAPERELPDDPIDPHRGPLEKAGKTADHAVDDAGGKLRRGLERAGDAADDAGDWIEEKTDVPGAYDAHDDSR